MTLETSNLICRTCGGQVELDESRKQGKCRFCKNVYHFKNEKSEALILALNRANLHRQKCDFREAIKEYQLIIDKMPNDSEAHFGMLLSVFGIEYVRDPRLGIYMPTCHRYVEADILKHPSYLAALSNSATEQRENYKEQAEAIAILLKRIKHQLEKEEDFDVFISFKSTDEDGNPTKDRLVARKVYDELTSRGIKVFFSEVTLKNRLGDEYEPIIFKALMSCKAFILVATSEENINSVWVKNEWSRFEDRIRDEHLNGTWLSVFNPSCRDSLPSFLHTQGIDLSKYPAGGYEIELADNIELKLGRKNQTNYVTADFEKEYKKWQKEKKDKRKEKCKFFFKKTFPYISAILAISAIVFISLLVRSSIIDNEQATAKIGVELAREAADKGDYYTAYNYYSSHKIQKLNDSAIDREFKSYEYAANGDYSNATKNGLSKIIIHDGVTSISVGAFSGCSELESIVIPDSVTSIGVGAFSGCSSLQSITLPFVGRSISDTYQYPFGYLFGTSTYDNAVKTEQHYKNESGEKESYTTFYIPKTLKTVTITGGYIPYGAFSNCEDIESIIIHNGYGVIGEKAFSHCSSLKEVRFDDNCSINEIGSQAFSNCSNLTTFKIPSDVDIIHELAFYQCSSLKSIIVPKQVSTIHNDAFLNCKSLGDLYFEGTLQDWSITVGSFNTSFENAAKYYYSANNPLDKGLYWKYDENGKVYIWN
ncbi:MAG: leucine-rich repeat protein [Clostridia bacterium]|nr:leucine-rich repeat protein [Clostridia bacterium]